MLPRKLPCSMAPGTVVVCAYGVRSVLLPYKLLYCVAAGTVDLKGCVWGAFCILPRRLLQSIAPETVNVKG